MVGLVEVKVKKSQKQEVNLVLHNQVLQNLLKHLEMNLELLNLHLRRINQMRMNLVQLVLRNMMNLDLDLEIKSFMVKLKHLLMHLEDKIYLIFIIYYV